MIAVTWFEIIAIYQSEQGIYNCEGEQSNESLKGSYAYMLVSVEITSFVNAMI